MTQDIDHLFMEQFKALRDGQRQIKDDVASVKTSLKSTNERLSSIDHHVMGIHASSIRHSDELDELKERINVLEKQMMEIRNQT